MFKRSRSFKKRSFKKRRPSRKGKSFTVAKVSNIIKTTMTRYAELKYWDVDATLAYSVVGAYNMVNLSAVTQGISDSQRVGDALTMSWVSVRIDLDQPDTSYGSNNRNLVRFILFQMIPPNNTAPTVADLLQTSNPADEIIHDKRQQYRILRDLQVPVNALYQSRKYIHFKAKIPKKTARVQYQSAGTAQNNALYLFSMAYGQGAAINTVGRLKSRLYYRDV